MPSPTATPSPSRADSYTQLKIPRATRNRAKAAAQLMGEELYSFVTTAIEERLDRLKKEGRLNI
jgi:hypothetical protein